MNDRVLTQSRITNFQCPYDYKINWVERIQLRWTPRPLRLGTLVHKGFEGALRANFDGENGVTQLLGAGKQAIKDAQFSWLNRDDIRPHITTKQNLDALELCDVAMKIFIRTFSALGVHEGKWETQTDKHGDPLIEYKLETRSASSYWKHEEGTLDWVAKEVKTGHLWLWDWKTRKALKPSEYDRFQLQHPFYLNLLRFDPRTRHLSGAQGAITYQIRAGVPRKPNLLKNGQMSIAACATDWNTYKHALLSNGLKPDDYRFMQNATDKNGNPKLSFRDSIERYYWSEAALKNVWQTVIQQGNRIAIAEQSKCYPKHISPYNCQGCKNRTLCEADIRGEDTEYFKLQHYIKKDEVPELTEIEIYDGADSEIG